MLDMALMFPFIAKVNLQDLGVVALLITAVTGAVSAILSHRQAKRVEKSKASTDSVDTLEGLVDRYRKEVERVDKKLDSVEIELEACRNDKVELQKQINKKVDKEDA